MNFETKINEKKTETVFSCCFLSGWEKLTEKGE